MPVRNLEELNATTLELLRWPNEVEPNANRPLADYLASHLGDIEAAVLLLSDHPGAKGLVGPKELESGRFALGLRRRANFDTLYIFFGTSLAAEQAQEELRDLFYTHGIHGLIGRSLRFPEVAEETREAWGCLPATDEVLLARWGYGNACGEQALWE